MGSSLRWHVRTNLAIALIGGLLGCLGAGCQSLAYYCQAARGQCDMLIGHREVADILDDPAESDALKARLRLAMELREFAQTQLGLPAEGSYLTYKHLDRPHSVWVVTASHEFSTELETWWYPVVGRFSARSFFNKADADACAQRLRQERFEVHVGGARAYSTLGWFRDPLLSTFIHDPDTELAELLFHELTHRRLFIANDTTFNESMATAVGQEGVRRWLLSRKDAPTLQKYEQSLRRQRQFVELIASTREQLQRLYVSGLRPEEMRTQKQAVHSRMKDRYEELKVGWGGHTAYDPWFAHPPTNPRMAGIATYYAHLPAFEALLRQCNGDLNQFFAEAESMGKAPSAIRKSRLLGLTQRAPLSTK